MQREPSPSLSIAVVLATNAPVDDLDVRAVHFALRALVAAGQAGR